MNTNYQHEVAVKVYCPVSPLPQLPMTLEYEAKDDENALPPVILHVRCESVDARYHNTKLVAFLEAHTFLTYSFLSELIEFGAVYAHVGVKTPQDSPRPSRATIDTNLIRDAPVYARIHATPKRHFARKGGTVRVLFDDSELMVVNKPAGLPVCATADNKVECITAMVHAHVTHRLDAPTCGLLIMAKQKEVVQRINNALSDAQKRYRVLTRAPPPIGRLKHWYATRAFRGRGPLRDRLIAEWVVDNPPPGTGWVDARLVVENVVQCVVEGETVWESTVLLETGRTHQIRVQFAASGCAVLGDTKYRDVEGKLLDDSNLFGVNELTLGKDAQVIGLCAAQLHLQWNGSLLRFHSDPPWWVST